jgi:hypothetical protein
VHVHVTGCHQRQPASLAQRSEPPQRRRVIARAQALLDDPRPLRVVFAPLFCMSLFGASRRGMLVARAVVVGVVTLVTVVRLLPQPSRGMVDAGVVVGLGLGLLSLLFHGARALAGRPPSIGADLP